MSDTRERRRNQKPGNCRACGLFCEAGQGWLYRDTHGRANRYTGRFGWFVKCDACHQGEETRASVKQSREAASREPGPRPWTVSQARTWTVERGEHEGDVALWLVGSFGRELMSYRHRISSEFHAASGWELECREIAGRPLSKAAADHLSPILDALADDIRRAEEGAMQEAIRKLQRAGATTARLRAGWGYEVKFHGRTGNLFGDRGGCHTINVMPYNGEPADETTADIWIADVTGESSSDIDDEQLACVS